MSATKRQVAEFQAAGLEPVLIARKLGITEGYISQLQNDTGFRDLLSQLTSANAVAQLGTHTKIDNHYNSLEESLASLLDENKEAILPTIVKKPAILMQFMRTLNGMKRRSSGEATQQQQAANSAVVLEMPAFLVEQSQVAVQHNAKNEVVQVEDTALVSMEASNLAEMANAQEVARVTQLEQQEAGEPEQQEPDLVKDAIQQLAVAPDLSDTIDLPSTLDLEYGVS